MKHGKRHLGSGRWNRSFYLPIALYRSNCSSDELAVSVAPGCWLCYFPIAHLGSGHMKQIRRSPFRPFTCIAFWENKTFSDRAQNRNSWCEWNQDWNSLCWSEWTTSKNLKDHKATKIICGNSDARKVLHLIWQLKFNFGGWSEARVLRDFWPSTGHIWQKVHRIFQFWANSKSWIQALLNLWTMTCSSVSLLFTVSWILSLHCQVFLARWGEKPKIFLDIFRPSSGTTRGLLRSNKITLYCCHASRDNSKQWEFLFLPRNSLKLRVVYNRIFGIRPVCSWFCKDETSLVSIVTLNVLIFFALVIFAFL